MTCNNCKTKLGCSCKRRTAVDGKACCTSCVAKYNNQVASTIKPSVG